MEHLTAKYFIGRTIQINIKKTYKIFFCGAVNTKIHMLNIKKILEQKGIQSGNMTQVE